MTTEIITTTPDCEIVSSRIFDNKRELIYRAWTDPNHLKSWWGPKGFTNTFNEFDFRVGGKWSFIMHGPDKGNYVNECEFIKIDEPSLIAWNRLSKPLFQVVATFEELSANKTKLIFKMLFNTAEDCRKVKAFAVDKNEENFDRLESELAKMTNKTITLIKTEEEDLVAFFQFQLDEEAKYLAAFTSKDSTDKNAYLERYTKFLTDPTIHMRTIKVNDEIAGSISKYEMEGDAEITYWIDKKFWGKGIATMALKDFLMMESARPIFGRVAFDNYGSQKVLEKCGFVRIGKDKGFANARQAEIEEYIYKFSGIE